MTNSVIKTQNIRLLTDKTEHIIRSIRATLNGDKLRKFDSNLQKVVRNAFAYAKAKVSNKFEPDTMYPGIEADAVDTYGRKIRSIIDPMVSNYLNVA